MKFVLTEGMFKLLFSDFMKLLTRKRGRQYINTSTFIEDKLVEANGYQEAKLEHPEDNVERKGKKLN